MWGGKGIRCTGGYMTREKPKLIERRTLSGRGLIRVNADIKTRRLYLYLNVVRIPKVDFTSSKFNPDKSEYAKIVWLRKDYVLREDVLNYEHQLLTWDVDPTGYLAKAILCMYLRNDADIAAIATMLGATVSPETPEIFLEPLADIPDEVKIVCRLDTAIDVQLWGYKYDIACEGADKPPVPPPDPPQPDKVPTGIAIGDISPPYDSPNDNGDTVPNPGDETAPPEPPPQGTPCTPIFVTALLTRFDETTTEFGRPVIAPFYSMRIRREGVPNVLGYAEYLQYTVGYQSQDRCNEEGQEVVEFSLANFSPTYKSAELLSIENA